LNAFIGLEGLVKLLEFIYPTLLNSKVYIYWICSFPNFKISGEYLSGLIVAFLLLISIIYIFQFEQDPVP